MANNNNNYYKYNFLCIVIIALILMTATFSAARRHKDSPTTTTTTNSSIPCSDFIRTCCSTKTTYPTLCLTTLCSRSNAIKSSPKSLAEAALSATLDATRFVAATMKHVPVTTNTIKDCLEVLDDSVEELKGSVSEMSRIHDVPQGQMGQGQLQLLGFHMNNVQTWVSAALTDDSTCTDGFDDDDDSNNNKDDHINIKVVRGMLLNIAQLTSNALALINSYANNITVVH